MIGARRRISCKIDTSDIRLEGRLAHKLRSTTSSQNGTVNLIGSDRDKAQEGRSHERLCPSGNAGDRGPGLEGLGPGGAILTGGEVVAAEVEQVVDPLVGGEETTGLAG